MRGGVTTPEQLRRIADVAEKYDGADGQADRRPADRPARHPEGGPARRLGRPRHAVGLRVRQVVPHREDLRRSGVLPVRHRRLDQARHRDRDPDAGHGEPGQDEAGRLRLPAQLRRVLRQGRRHRRHRGRPLGDLRRRRGRRAHPQGRPALHRRRRRDGQAAHRPVPAVLPGERQVAGAHLRVRARGSASSTSARSSSTTARASPSGSTPRCRSTPTRYVDPWTAGRRAGDPGQFRTSLPLEVLPQVPADRAEQLLGGAW